MAEERLQKILRSAGITSRRKAEALIQAGRVRVDGKIVTELGTKANPRRAKVELDGQRVQPEPFCYGVMHKPRGMVSTMSDPEGRPTAQDVLRQVGVRVVPIGRLDFNTSGVLLFTNDGDFAQAISHASGKAPKVYAAKVQQVIDEQSLARWAEAIEIEGKMTRPADIRILRREGDKTWLQITLVEGKNRQVRRLGEHAKTPVVRLSRLAHADITAEGLRPGQWRLLSVDELLALKKKFGVPKKVHAQTAIAAARRSKPSAAAHGPEKTRGKSAAGSPDRSKQKTAATSKNKSNKDSARATSRSSRSLSEGKTRGGKNVRESTRRSGSAPAGSRRATSVKKMR